MPLDLEDSNLDDITPVKESDDADKLDQKKPCYRKNKIAALVVKIAVEMIDFRILFKSPKLTLMCLSAFCHFFIYFIPFVFIPIRAKEVIGDSYPWVISVIGKLNCET